MTAAAPLRKPEFLAAVTGGATVEPAGFLDRRSVASLARTSLSASAPAEPAAASVTPAPPAPPPAAPIFTVVPGADTTSRIAALERELADTAARVELSVERLRAAGERLAAEARADALEIALIAARRVVEGELTINPASQLHFIRAALSRLGEVRTAKIRLAPAQAAALAAARAESELAPTSTARVEIVPDSSLQPGDCVIDGDLATIDGRLDTRFEEIRRSVLASAEGEEP